MLARAVFLIVWEKYVIVVLINKSLIRKISVSLMRLI